MENNDNWILQEMHIHPDWTRKGAYAGNVKFKNGVKMEFALLLDEAKCSKLIAILKDEIIDSASKLGEMMIKSMPVALPASNPGIDSQTEIV